MAQVRLSSPELQTIQAMLERNPPQRELWLQKCRRLREATANLPAGGVISTSVREGTANQMLVNTVIKTHTLMQLMRGTQLVWSPHDDAIAQGFVGFVAEHAYALHRALMSRIIVGLGAVCIVGKPNAWRLEYVSPSDLWWDCETGDLMRPRWIAREYRDAEGNRYRELWYPDKRCVWDIARNTLTEHPNPYGVIPIVLFAGIHVPDTVYPIGDVELVLTAQTLRDEATATMIEMARRGAGFLAVVESAIDERELSRLTDPGEVFVLVKDPSAIVPINTPVPNPEWLALLQMAKSNMDELMGISEYIRGMAPVNAPKTATEVMAAIAGQNARIAAEWYTIQMAYETLGRVYYKLHRPHLQVSVRVADDAAPVGLQPTQAGGAIDLAAAAQGVMPAQRDAASDPLVTQVSDYLNYLKVR